jgi:translation initiation factor 2 alpha subunit (eIF-2alpha)
VGTQDTGGDTGIDPSQFINLINQLIQNGASTDDVNNLKTEIVALLTDVASQESVDKVQATVDQILGSLTDVAKQSTLLKLRTELFGLIDGLATQSSVDSLAAKVAANEAAGMTRDQAIQTAIQDLSTQLGLSVEELATAIGENRDAINDIGIDIGEINTAITNIQNQLKDVATKEQVQNLADLVAEYESQGLSRDEALKQAIQDLSEQTGQSVEEIQAAINANQDLIIDLGLDIDELNNAVTNIQNQLKDVATKKQVQDLADLVAEYESQGLSRDEALQQAIQDLSEQTGQSVEEIQAVINANQDLIIDLGLDIDELNNAVTNIQEQLKDVATKEQVQNLADLVAEYESQGLSRDEALAQGLSDLAEQLGTDVETLANSISENADSLATLGVTTDELVTAVGDIQETLGTLATREQVQKLSDLIAEYESQGLSRDEALAQGVADLSAQLGITEQELLNQITSTEQRLTTELDAISELIGKPPGQVTDVDIDFVADIIAQQEALGEMLQYNQQQLGYDVTGDGIVDINDLNLLQQAQQGEQVDLSKGQQFQPTGLYQYSQNLAQQTQQQIAAEAEKTRRYGDLGDLLGLLGEAQDISGREVTVQAPDPAKIGYLYDFSSIFATPQQEGMFVSPYGQRGYAEGGSIVDANEELLRLLGE